MNTDSIDEALTVEEVLSEDVGDAPEGVDPVLWKSWDKWQDRNPNDFIYQVMRGVEGKNVGLANGLKNINKYLYGTHMARYYLIGADSSVGKTTVADFMYVHKAWQSARKLKRRIRIFYCSFEIGKLDKIAGWTSYYIFEKFGVQLPSDYILGRINGKLPTREHVNMIKQAYDYISLMMKDIVFIEDVVHPTKIFEDLIAIHYDKEGKVLRTDVSAEDKKLGKKGYVKGYVAKDPDLMTALVIDHLALTGSEQKLDTKQIMDRMSKYAVVLRNIFHTTVVFIQQFSTDLMSWHRTAKKSEESIAPQRLDFGDSKATFRDACVVIGLTCPASFDYDSFKGYQLIGDESFGRSFLAGYIMKNRYGPSGRLLPLFLNGITKHVYDLPLVPNNMIEMQEWYDKAREIRNLIETFKPTE